MKWQYGSRHWSAYTQRLTRHSRRRHIGHAYIFHATQNLLKQEYTQITNNRKQLPHWHGDRTFSVVQVLFNQQLAGVTESYKFTKWRQRRLPVGVVRWISHNFRNGSHFSCQEMIGDDCVSPVWSLTLTLTLTLPCRGATVYPMIVYASTCIPWQQGERERIWGWVSPSSLGG